MRIRTDLSVISVTDASLAFTFEIFPFSTENFKIASAYPFALLPPSIYTIPFSVLPVLNRCECPPITMSNGESFDNLFAKTSASECTKAITASHFKSFLSFNANSSDLLILESTT